MINRFRSLEQELANARYESEEQKDILTTLAEGLRRDNEELRRDNKRLIHWVKDLDGDVKALRCVLRTSPPHTHTGFAHYRAGAYWWISSSLHTRARRCNTVREWFFIWNWILNKHPACRFFQVLFKLFYISMTMLPIEITKERSSGIYLVVVA